MQESVLDRLYFVELTWIQKCAFGSFVKSSLSNLY